MTRGNRRRNIRFRTTGSRRNTGACMNRDPFRCQYGFIPHALFAMVILFLSVTLFQGYLMEDLKNNLQADTFGGDVFVDRSAQIGLLQKVVKFRKTLQEFESVKKP